MMITIKETKEGLRMTTTKIRITTTIGMITWNVKMTWTEAKVHGDTRAASESWSKKRLTLCSKEKFSWEVYLIRWILLNFSIILQSSELLNLLIFQDYGVRSDREVLALYFLGKNNQFTKQFSKMGSTIFEIKLLK